MRGRRNTAAGGARGPGALLAGALLAGAVLTGGSCSPGADDTAAESPAVILITLDTFRADHLGASGHPAVRTPFLDRLARRATQWTDAVSPIPLTTPSHATILTGLTPRAHGLLKNRMVLSGGVETIAERLGADGYRTGAVVSSFTVLGPELDLDQGFDSYEVVRPEVRPASGEGARTTDAAIAWLDSHGGPGSFLWVHYFDTHLPYLPPPPLDRLYDPDYDGPFLRPAEPVQAHFRDAENVDPRDVAHLIALYASEVTFLDRCVGRLLRAEGARDAAVVVTADHGEGLYEHERYFGHDILLYDTSVRVPLLVAVPETAGGLSTEPARTTDVAPTIAGICAREWEGREGRDLFKDRAPEGDDRLFALETYPQQEKAEPLYALRTGTEKVIWIQRERRHEYYDLAADPAERTDLGPEPPESLRILGEDLELDLRNRPPERPRTLDDDQGMDDATREALESLGYLETGT